MRKSIALLVISVLTACQAQQDTLKLSIEAMEEEARNSNVLDTGLVNSLTQAYSKYIDKNPSDSISPYYLQRSADILRVQKGREEEAIAQYQKIIDDYPDHVMVPRSLFMIGFTYDENLKKNAKAIKFYEEFLQKYPNHSMANDATHLKNLLVDSAVSDIDKVKQWMQQNQEQTNPNQ